MRDCSAVAASQLANTVCTLSLPLLACADAETVAATGTSSEAEGAGPGERTREERERERAKSDSRTQSELQKLYDCFSLQKGRKSVARGDGEKLSKSPQQPGPSDADKFLQVSLSVLKELDAGRKLFDFCLSLRVFEDLSSEGAGFLGGDNGDLSVMVGRWVCSVHNCACFVWRSKGMYSRGQ